MTREELREHCEKQIKECEMWAKHKGEEPSGKVYEEHKLILELLDQELFKPMVEIDLYSVIKQKYIEREVIDKIRAEFEEHVGINQNLNTDRAKAICWCLDVIDKYVAETEDQNGIEDEG